MREFLKGVFSDNGAPSFSRLATAVLVMAAIVWVTRIVFVTGMLPELTGLAFFVGFLYGTNVGGNILKGRSAAGNGTLPNGSSTNSTEARQ